MDTIKKIWQRTCIINIFCIFALVRSKFRVSNGPANRGHFLCSLQYGGGSFTSRKGDPEQGSDSVNDHRFFIGLMSKTCSIMKDLSSANGTSKAISAEKILNHLLLCDDVKHLRQVLQSTTMETLLHEDDEYSRGEIYNYWLAFDNFFRKLKKYENQIKLDIAS